MGAKFTGTGLRINEPARKGGECGQQKECPGRRTEGFCPNGIRWLGRSGFFETDPRTPLFPGRVFVAAGVCATQTRGAAHEKGEIGRYPEPGNKGTPRLTRR